MRKCRLLFQPEKKEYYFHKFIIKRIKGRDHLYAILEDVETGVVSEYQNIQFIDKPEE